jgi:2-polyprenyl-3-methyl-5-hydroxy-6-metoxy-1,4-benzoquinol methylase
MCHQGALTATRTRLSWFTVRQQPRVCKPAQSPLAKFTSRLSKVLRNVLPRRYYSDPQTYWEQRHLSSGLSLEGVGRLYMGEEANLVDYETKWTHISAALQSIKKPTESTLFDAGCGTGWLTDRVFRLGFKVEARDFSPAAVELAKRRTRGHNVAWSVGPIHTASVGSTFDVVICIDVLFHVVDDDLWRRSVETLQSLVHPSGLLLIQEHLVEERISVVANGATHTRWRTLADYTNVLTASTLLERDTYWLDGERDTKDLLTFRRHN